MKKLTILIILLFYANFIYAQSVDVKDGDDNSLITINDEGTAGSITIPSGPHPSTKVNKLYNSDGLLHWSGNILTTGNPLWSINGSGDIYRNTGKVGIGTVSPSRTLHVIGENISDATGYFENTSAGPTYTYAVFGDCSSGPVYGIGGWFKGVKRGVVGEIRRTVAHIGPGPDMLDYVGTLGQVISSDLAIGNGTNYGVRGYAYYGDINYGVYGNAVGNTGTVENFGVYGTASGTGTNWAGYFEGRGYFSGNTGIGVENPAAALHVNNKIRIGNFSGWPNLYGEIYHAGAGSGYYGLRINANAGGGWADMHLQTDGNTRVFIESGGNVGIGTTSPTKKLYVSGSAGGTQAWNASDLRYKKNIYQVERALSGIKQLRGVKYEWKNQSTDESTGFDDKIHYGLIAQEVEEVFPELVDNIGKTEQMKHIEYNGLVGILVESIKEQQELIEDLTKRIEYLESN